MRDAALSAHTHGLTSDTDANAGNSAADAQVPDAHCLSQVKQVAARRTAALRFAQKVRFRIHLIPHRRRAVHTRCEVHGAQITRNHRILVLHNELVQLREAIALQDALVEVEAVTKSRTEPAGAVFAVLARRHFKVLRNQLRRNMRRHHHALAPSWLALIEDCFHWPQALQLALLSAAFASVCIVS